ncbi:hypothetical protein D9757_006128 [Collybiopsis confluens]|uniref:NADP-dependent oxidoreductase domain-containing protein n=1 Tax=Collybiopsis confluens TaxID=2823264 RepID=A0A8H5M7E1_9AGAR|nr:hypothetical protein D9757_006128 [Collybiopsis confluens]
MEVLSGRSGYWAKKKLLNISRQLTMQGYSNGLSEVILGKAIKQLNLPRPEIVVMTKCFMVVARSPGEVYLGNAIDLADTVGYVNQHGLSRKVGGHRFDPDTPIPEVMQALHDIVQAGHVRYIGMSSCWAWQFQAMQSGSKR